MTIRDIVRIRLLNQQLAATNFTTPQQVVGWMIAQQAQEYTMAKWAIGLRAKNLTGTIVVRSIAPSLNALCDVMTEKIVLNK